MIALERIVVATDFGRAAEAALAYGRELARTFGAKLDVLHVVEEVSGRAVGIDGYVAIWPEIQSRIEDAARERLELLLSEADRAVLGARGVIRTSNWPALEIVAYADRTRANLIVVGTHGRGAMAQLLIGSVAERVVRTAPCPVLTIRHPEHEFVLPDNRVAVATT